MHRLISSFALNRRLHQHNFSQQVSNERITELGSILYQLLLEILKLGVDLSKMDDKFG
jgi:hypothetical protein